MSWLIRAFSLTANQEVDHEKSLASSIEGK
jgi:hypothetical protein